MPTISLWFCNKADTTRESTHHRRQGNGQTEGSGHRREIEGVKQHLFQKMK